MRLKSGDGRARLIGVRPELVLAALVIDGVMDELHVAQAARVISACTDGTHHSGSLHYLGLALDVRTHDVPVPPLHLAEAIASALGLDFHVLVENQGLPTEHVHVELHPAYPLNVSPTTAGA